MQLVIIHYHLNRGGVTRVIQNHLLGLSELPDSDRPRRVLLITGPRQSGWDVKLSERLSFPLIETTLDDLDYDAVRSIAPAFQAEPGGLIKKLERLLSDSGFHQSETILHIHNHSLGKNAALTMSIHGLARRGWRLLLQPHDFAEELRPGNYRHLIAAAESPAELQACLYPRASHVHYATLNGRDAAILRAAEQSGLSDAGEEPSRVHLLPNSVAPMTERVPRDVAKKEVSRLGISASDPYILFPVRGIRRKNVGELLLWASLFPAARFAITLAPSNPDELPSFRGWQQLSGDLDLGVLFDVGNSGGVSFAANMAAADAILTTSVAEGFGLVFLEAAMAGLPLFGRDLPEITGDFREFGMAFPGLSPTVKIPWEWIDRDAVEDNWRQTLIRLQQDYGLDEDAIAIDSTAPDLDSATVDFGRLPRSHQLDFLTRLSKNDNWKDQLTATNSAFRQLDTCLGVLASAGDLEASRPLAEEIVSNQVAIREHYSLAAIACRYHAICNRILCSPVGEVECKEQVGKTVLEQFFSPDRLFPIRLDESTEAAPTRGGDR